MTDPWSALSAAKGANQAVILNVENFWNKNFLHKLLLLCSGKTYLTVLCFLRETCCRNLKSYDKLIWK